MKTNDHNSPNAKLLLQAALLGVIGSCFALADGMSLTGNYYKLGIPPLVHLKVGSNDPTISEPGLIMGAGDIAGVCLLFIVWSLIGFSLFRFRQRALAEQKPSSLFFLAGTTTTLLLASALFFRGAVEIAWNRMAANWSVNRLSEAYEMFEIVVPGLWLSFLALTVGCLIVELRNLPIGKRAIHYSFICVCLVGVISLGTPHLLTDLEHFRDMRHEFQRQMETSKD